MLTADVPLRLSWNLLDGWCSSLEGEVDSLTPFVILALQFLPRWLLGQMVPTSAVVDFECLVVGG